MVSFQLVYLEQTSLKFRAPLTTEWLANFKHCRSFCIGSCWCLVHAGCFWSIKSYLQIGLDSNQPSLSSLKLTLKLFKFGLLQGSCTRVRFEFKFELSFDMWSKWYHFNCLISNFQTHKFDELNTPKA